MIKISINVVKIDKKRLKEGKNGAKYLDCVLIDTPNDKFGNDFMVVESVSKEERESGVRGAIIGNGKDYSKGKEFDQRPARNTEPEDSDDSRIPF
jgi:hypothetical protein